jgi:alanine-glyoxylate transaminase/serine-glyoxylate transaminase/serine-pyruvate transaminase
MRHRSGRHFLQIPGPTNVPERVLRAIGQATIDHRGPAFAEMTREVLEAVKRVFKTSQPVLIFPGSGTGGWEAALVNTLSLGDKVLMFETGQFSANWKTVAERFGLEVDYVAGDWRHGVDPAVVESTLAEDGQHQYKAVAVVHNETSTGVTSLIPDIRRAMDRVGHPALLLVDVISSLGSTDYRHDAWGVDVTVAASQKGLMLPPGLSFNAVSEKARAASESAGLPRSFWRWDKHFEMNQKGFFPTTPATNLLFGLREALDMLEEEGLDAVFTRHEKLAEATRRAVVGWGLELQCVNPKEYSASTTAVRLPEGHDANALRDLILDRFDMSLGTGLGKVRGLLFRIGHLGDFNELMLMGTLCGVEMGLELANVPFSKGGVAAAMDYLASDG